MSSNTGIQGPRTCGSPGNGSSERARWARGALPASEGWVSHARRMTHKDEAVVPAQRGREPCVRRQASMCSTPPGSPRCSGAQLRLLDGSDSGNRGKARPARRCLVIVSHVIDAP